MFIIRKHLYLFYKFIRGLPQHIIELTLETTYHKDALPEPIMHLISPSDYLKNLPE